MTVLRAAINRLMEDEKIPYVKIPFPSKLKETDSKIRDRYLLPEERTLLLNETEELAKRHLYILPAIILSLYTGVRKGTLMELKWSDVDFVSKNLSLRASIMKGGKFCVIPLNSTVIDCLVTWRLKSPNSEYIIC